MPLSPEDQFRVNKAEGYLELGMCSDAEAELEQIAPDAMQLPEMLAVWIGVFQETERWAAMQAAAKKLALLDPTAPQWAIAWAYATRRVESIDIARIILIEALERHPSEPLIHYNLACYDCQLGDIPSAKKFIETALHLNPKMGRMALGDEDLEPLWASLESLNKK